MTKATKVLPYLLILLIMCSFATALCTVELNDNNPAPGQFVTAIMSCSSNNERNIDYTLTWYDQDDLEFDSQTGITPSESRTPFFESATIPITVTNGTVELTGTNLEGEDTFIVVESNNTLLLVNSTFTNPVLIGKSVGIKFLVTDSDNNLLNGAICNICGENNQQVPLGVCDNPFQSTEGEVNGLATLSFSAFREDQQYIASANCLYDQNGDNIFENAGQADFPFTISKWLNITVLTNSPLYFPEQEIFICANVTNNI